MVGRRHEDRGAAAVEFALVAPVFIALLFGIISFGWMLSYRQSISQGAAEGARVLAVSPAGSPTLAADARTAVNRSLASYGVSCDGSQLKHGTTVVGTCTIPTASTPCTNNTALRCATVSITHAYRDHPLIPSFPGLGVVLPRNLSFSTTVEVGS